MHERLSWPEWLTYSGWFSHILVTHRLQVERRTGKDRRDTVIPRGQPCRRATERRPITDEVKCHEAMRACTENVDDDDGGGSLCLIKAAPTAPARPAAPPPHPAVTLLKRRGWPRLASRDARETVVALPGYERQRGATIDVADRFYDTFD